MSPARRTTTALAAVAALAAGTLAGSSPASAAASCTVDFNTTTAVNQTIAPIVTYSSMPDLSSGYYVQIGRLDAGGAFLEENSFYNVSHTITSAETDKYVRLFAFGNGSGAQNSTCYSPVSPVTPLPVTTGRRTVGKKLTATVVPVQAGTTVSYQWLRTKKHRPAHAIAGATGPRYKVKRRDRHRKISAQVTYTRLGYTTLVLVSNTKRIR